MNIEQTTASSGTEVVVVTAPRDALEYVRRMMLAAARQERRPPLASEELDYIERCLCDLQFAIMDEMTDDLNAPDVVHALNKYRSRLLCALNEPPTAAWPVARIRGGEEENIK